MEIFGLRFHLFPFTYLFGISYGEVHSRLTFPLPLFSLQMRKLNAVMKNFMRMCILSS